MTRKLPRHFFGLSRIQVERLIEALRGSRPSDPGISYLADQGFGWRSARAWYQTFRSLKERDLVYMPRRADESLLQAYRLTAEGRKTIEQILRSWPELNQVPSVDPPWADARCDCGAGKRGHACPPPAARKNEAGT